MMSSKSAYLNASGGIPSGPAALPVIIFFLTFWYSSNVKGDVVMSLCSSKMVFTTPSESVMLGGIS